MKEMYDLIVIGGGPGGYLAAERAAHAGLKTILFEKRSLGGVCLNEGCIPSKTLLQSAKTYEHALHSNLYGVSCHHVTIDQKAVIARKAKVVRTLVAGVKGKMKAAGVTVVMETATITGKTAEGFIIEAGEKQYIGKRLIIATGSSAAVPPIPGVKENLGEFVPDAPMIVLFVTDNPELRDKIGTDLAVVHMGLWLPNGMLRHASSSQGAVVDVDMNQYVQMRMQDKTNLGIALVEIKK